MNRCVAHPSIRSMESGAYTHGEIRTGSLEQGRACDARAKARDAHVGGVREQGDESEAGDRDRLEGSTAVRCQGAGQTGQQELERPRRQTEEHEVAPRAVRGAARWGPSAKKPCNQTR